MILKLKSIIYKYTGIFLAYKEEHEYIQSKDFWKSFIKISTSNDMNLRDTQGLLIGMWQVKHGFARPGSFLRFRRPRFFWRFIEWWVILFTVLKWDVKFLLTKTKKLLYNKGKR